MSETRTFTKTLTVHRLPRKVVTMSVLDWDAVYERLKQGDAVIYEATQSDTRNFTNWAKRKHGHYMFYRTVEPGLVEFSLEKQRGKKGPSE